VRLFALVKGAHRWPVQLVFEIDDGRDAASEEPDE
jgi:hypothetical protein